MEKNKIFAKDYSYYKIFSMFIIGSIIGYIYESILAIFQTGAFINKQELIYGPFAPVYGLGAVLFLLVCKNLKGNIKIFIAAAISGGVLEYLYSFFQEMFFGTISWDYSNAITNIEGRTTIIYCIGWGLLGIVYMKWIYPGLSKLIEKIPYKIGVPITWVMVIFMVFNINITIFSSVRQNERRKSIQPKNNIDTFYDTHYPDWLLKERHPNRRSVSEEK